MPDSNDKKVNDTKGIQVEISTRTLGLFTKKSKLDLAPDPMEILNMRNNAIKNIDNVEIKNTENTKED